jgi:flavin-dependent dehydrogenase
MRQTGVILVGSGPAGSACAWKLKQAGVDFILLDKAAFPRVKPCAGWITPQIFRDMEITPSDYPYALTHFERFQVWIKNFHFTLRTNQYAIRRVEFDHWLLQRAGLEPVQHAVRSILYENGQYLVDGEFSAPVIVGAGGTFCPVRQTFFKEAGKGTLIVAQEEEFSYDYTDARCHLWFIQNGLPGYAWYVPKADGVLNVGVGGDAAALKANKDTLKRHWEMLEEKLAREGLVRGHAFRPAGHAYALRAKKPLVRSGNAFLVGDALGLATRDMGEGIGPAIRSGILAAQAILNKQDYSTASIARFSFPSLVGWRR